MSKAMIVFAMSWSQLDMLYRTDYSIKNGYVLPFYTRTPRTPVVLSPSSPLIEEINSKNSFVYDILTYGACSPNRLALNDKLKAYGRQYNRNIKIICVGNWTNAVFGEELERIVKESKVVVNNHSFNRSSLQTHRLTYLFSLHKCIVSERSEVDEGLDRDYEDAVIFADSNNYDEIINKAHIVLEDEHLFRSCQRRSWLKYVAIHSDLNELSKAVYKAYEIVVTS
jgi:hypothetical protein